MGVPAVLPLDRPFNAEHVSVVGKGGVLSRKDLRTVIERLGGSCAFTLSSNTTVVVTTGDPLPAEWPPRVRRVMTEDELCRATAREIHTPVRVAAALEAVAGIRAQAERLARVADVRRREIGRLQQHVHRLIIDLRVLPAHDTGERDALGFVGDQQILRGQPILLAVQRLELLPCPGTTHDDRGRA